MTTIEKPPSNSPVAQELSAAEAIGPRKAPAPVAAAGASRAGVVLALVVTGVGVVGIRDAVIAAGWTTGTQWLPVAATAVDGLEPAVWMVPAGIVAAVLGVIAMVVAVLPRRRTALALVADSAVYVTRADVAKIAAAAAAGVPGVLDARATASRRKAVVRCRVTGDSHGLQQAVARAVSEALDALQNPPRVVVHTRTETTS